MNLYKKIILVSILLWPLLAEAEFDLNFMPNNSTASFSTCVTHGGTSCAGGTQTRYLQEGGLQLPETVIDPDNGLTYYHMIIGNPDDGFVQEVYVRTGSYGSYQGGSLSGSSGAINNGQDPLDINSGIITGNGGANPKNIIMRQIVSDGEMTDEFLKDQYARKPVISQSINAPDITTGIVIDMRNSTYSDKNTPGTILNTMSLQGAEAPENQASFNMADDAQNSYVNAGRYTYTNGSGRGGSDGTYSYVDGGSTDLANTPWENFFDPATSGKWSYTANRPN